MALDHQRVVGQLQHIGLIQAVAVALLHRHLDRLHQLAAARFLLGRGKHHLDQLGAQVAPDHGLLARLQHRFMHIELVWVHGALHHRLAQAVAAGDEDHVFKARFGVDGEHHPGRAEVGAHHALHPSRERHLGVRKALVDAVADGAVVVEAGKHLFDFVQHVGYALHIQKGFLLPSKGGVGQVFGGGRGAHGVAGAGAGAVELRVGGAYGLLQGGRKGLGLDHGADFGAALRQRAHVVGVERVQLGLDALMQAIGGQKLAKGVRGGGKTSGHAHALRQLRDHLAEAGVFASHGFDIAHSELLEGHDQGGRVKQLRHGETPKLKNRASRCGRWGRSLRAQGPRPKPPHRCAV